MKNKEAWKKFKEFPIGAPVECKRKFIESWDGHKKEWVEQFFSIDEGWISGATWVCNGSTEIDKYNGSKSWYATDKIPCFLVRKNMFGREYKVPVDAVKRIHECRAVDLYIMKHDYAYPWRESDREAMRKKAEMQPRDSKGRFIKSVEA